LLLIIISHCPDPKDAEITQEHTCD